MGPMFVDDVEKGHRAIKSKKNCMLRWNELLMM